MTSKTAANKTQIAAHAANPLLLKPLTGMQVAKLTAVTEERAQNMLAWMRSHATYEEMSVTIRDLLAQLRFGVAAPEFERAFDELGRALGFTTQRPDKQFKAGPDNLWALGGDRYALFEAKSEVAKTRLEIFKVETGQMNNACGWFNEQYPAATGLRCMITPARRLATGAVFNDDVRLMRVTQLDRLIVNVRAFFTEFRDVVLADIFEASVQQRLVTHKLTVKDLLSPLYSEPPSM